MELSINDKKMKEIIKEVMLEIIKKKKKDFGKIIMEAVEEIGLANAIIEGRKNKFVSEKKILEILKG